MKKLIQVATVTVATASLIVLGGCTGNQQSNQHKQQPAPKVSVKQTQQQQNTTPSTSTSASASAPVDQTAAVNNAAEDYYDAAASGDFVYTYNHLSSNSQAQFTEDQWIGANKIGGSDQASYQITNVQPTTAHAYSVSLLVNGSPRTTTFVDEGNGYVHALTPDEVAMFQGDLASPSASASASASAAPSSAGRVPVRVVVSANKPVDVSILSVKDGQVPMIGEETANKTYNFAMKPSADLQVAATDAKMDFGASDDISIQVYENGQLKSQDTDSFAALVQF